MLLILEDFRQRMNMVPLHDFRYGYNWLEDAVILRLVKYTVAFATPHLVQQVFTTGAEACKRPPMPVHT